MRGSRGISSAIIGVAISDLPVRLRYLGDWNSADASSLPWNVPTTALDPALHAGGADVALDEVGRVRPLDRLELR